MKIKICIEEGCQNAQTTKDYCRLHYLRNWKNIKETARLKAADRLNKYVDGLCKKFPEKYVDVIRRDIKTGKDDFGFDESASADEISEDVFGKSGFQDDDSIDRLISHIKVDKDF